MNTATHSCTAIGTAIASAVAAVCLATASPAAQAQTEAQTQLGSVVPVKDWDVYVDLPTRFAFVKSPKGWVFVRQLDEEQMTRLPASTLTALLLVDDSEIRYAHPALEPSPRGQALRDSEIRQAAASTAVSAAR